MGDRLDFLPGLRQGMEGARIHEAAVEGQALGSLEGPIVRIPQREDARGGRRLTSEEFHIRGSGRDEGDLAVGEEEQRRGGTPAVPSERRARASSPP